MDEIETVLKEEDAQLIIDKLDGYWRAVIRNDQFGEIVDASAKDTEDDPLKVLLYNLNTSCIDWLAEVDPD